MNVFDLFAKISLDSSNYEKGLENAKGKAQSFSSILKKGLTAVAKGSAVALGAAATAVVALTKKAVESYAEYEQLAGGIKKLYGDASKTVMAFANEAYKTVGMSANEYMSNATAFSAKLISDFGGDAEKAATYSDKALRQIADNANTFGKYSVQELTGVYQALAGGNYQTLDNLNLGVAGTKQGLQDLLRQAEEITGIKYDVENFGDVIDAIGVVQDKLNITGTTAKEASKTIQGSFGVLGAAWKNLLAGLARPDADLSGLIGHVVDSAEAAFNNLLPVVERALSGIGTFVEKIAPVVAEKLPGMVENALPALLSAATSVVNGIVAALPTIISVLVAEAPTIINQLVTALLDNLDAIVDAAFQLIFGLAQGLIDNLPTLLEKAGEVITKLCLEILANIDQFINVSIDLITALANGLIQNIDILIDKAPEIVYKLVVAIIKNAPKLLQAALELILTLAAGLAENFGKLVEKGREIVDKVKSGFSEKVESAKKWGKDLMDNFVNGIKEKWENLKQSVSNVAGSIKNLLGFSEPKEGPLSNFHTYAPDMMKLFAKGVRDNTPLVTDQLKKSFSFEPTLTPSLALNGEYSTQSNQDIIDAIDRLGERFDTAFDGFTLDLNEREFGRLVKEFA